jgi:hypothetical protein
MLPETYTSFLICEFSKSIKLGLLSPLWWKLTALIIRFCKENTVIHLMELDEKTNEFAVVFVTCTDESNKHFISEVIQLEKLNYYYAPGQAGAVTENKTTFCVYSKLLDITEKLKTFESLEYVLVQRLWDVRRDKYLLNEDADKTTKSVLLKKENEFNDFRLSDAMANGFYHTARELKNIKEALIHRRQE